MQRKNKPESEVKAGEKDDSKGARTTWKQRIELIAVGFAILAFIEALIRIFGLAPAARPRDPLMEGGEGEQAYELVKADDGTSRYECVWKNPEFEYNYQPIPAVKENDEIRIFVFGGSSAVGYPYDGRLAFSQFLEAGLGEIYPDKKIRVFNVAQNAIPAGTNRRLMTEMARYEPDIFVVYSGNNEYSDQHLYRYIRKRVGTIRGLQRSFRHLALYRSLEKIILPAKMRVYSEYVLSEEGIQPPAYSPEERRIIMDNYEYVIQSMADFCREERIGLVLCTVAANSADWMPYRSTFKTSAPQHSRSRWLEIFAEALDAYEAGNLQGALTFIDQAMEIDDTRADAHFLRGRIRMELGRPGQATESFHRALDLDNVCYRASPTHNNIIKKIAIGSDALLADTEDALKGVAPNGILGFNFFWDHCHPNPDAHRVFAIQIALTMIAGGLLPEPESGWERRFGHAITRWQRTLDLTPAFKARAYRNTAPGWMGLWTSHRGRDQLLRMQSKYLEGAFHLLEKAIEEDPALPGSYFYRGVINAQMGDMENARADWRRELALDSADGPMRHVLEGLLEGRIPPDRGFESWLFIRNEMIR